MQNISIGGRLARDAENRTTQGGQPVCSFTVPVDQGFGENKSTNWYRCSLWGKRGEKLGQYLTKGTAVAVAGELSLSEYEGKTQLNINVSDLTLLGGKKDSGGAPTHPNQDFNDGAGSGALDDDVPFATNDFAYERKRPAVL